MNPILLGIGSVIVIGTGAGFVAYQHFGGDLPSGACADWPLQEREGEGVIRFAIENTGPAKTVTVCAVTYGQEKVATRTLTIPAETVYNVDLYVPGGRYAAVIDAGFQGSASAHLWPCGAKAVRIPIELYEQGGSISGGDCFDPASDQAGVQQQALLPAETLRGPAGPAIGVGLGAAGLTAALLGFRHRVHFAFLLFTRLARPKVLQLETRARIHELVNAEPGIHANAIADRLDLANGETFYHLHVLVRERSLVRVGNWGLRSFFVAGRYAASQMRAMAALRSSALKRVYLAVRQQPGASLARVAEASGYSVGRASRLSRRLEEAGLIERHAQGRSLVLSPRAGFDTIMAAQAS